MAEGGEATARAIRRQLRFMAASGEPATFAKQIGSSKATRYTGNAAKRKLMEFVPVEHLQRMAEVFFDGKIPPEAVEVYEE